MNFSLMFVADVTGKILGPFVQAQMVLKLVINRVGWAESQGGVGGVTGCGTSCNNININCSTTAANRGYDPCLDCRGNFWIRW